MNNDDSAKNGPAFQMNIRVSFLSDLIGELQQSSNHGKRGESVEWTTGKDYDSHRNGRSRTRRSQNASEECHLDTRLADDEFVILADLPATSLDEITIGLTPSHDNCVIAQNEHILAKVPIPWDCVESTDASFNNGVLEVRLTPA